MSVTNFGVLAVIFSVVVQIIWLVFAYRAMKAHEKLAEALRRQEVDINALIKHQLAKDKYNEEL